MRMAFRSSETNANSNKGWLAVCNFLGEQGVMVLEVSNELSSAVQETLKKVQSSLLGSIQSHVNSSEFDVGHGLDFLDSKNSMMLSYLIELTVYIRAKMGGTDVDAGNIHRLTEMKVAIDKVRGLDKKLKYQIDKLLAAQSTSASFAVGGEDPLDYQPDVDAMDNESDSESLGSAGSDREGDDDDDGSEAADDNDDDLAAARMTLTLAKEKSKEAKDEESGVYRAPRLAAAPYTHDQSDRQAEREKRMRRRMRASEVAQTLRNQYGEAPEQEDIHGGSDLGKQKEASRRFAEREAEKTRYEEDTMVRLTITRKEKKERKRLMRQEQSNLAALADLRHITKNFDFGANDKSNQPIGEDQTDPERYSNGKRKRIMIDKDGRALNAKGRKSIQSKNEYQNALFGDSRGSTKKKIKKR